MGRSAAAHVTLDMQGALGPGRGLQIPHFDPVPTPVTDPAQLPEPPRLQLTPPAMVAQDANRAALARDAMDPRVIADVFSHYAEPTPARRGPVNPHPRVPRAEAHGEEGESPVELDATIDPQTGEPEVEASVRGRVGPVTLSGAAAVAPTAGEGAVRAGASVPVGPVRVGVEGGASVGPEGVRGTAGGRVTVPLPHGGEGTISGGVTVAPPHDEHEHPEVTPGVGVGVRWR